MSQLKQDIRYIDMYIQRIVKYCNDQESNYFAIGYNLNELKRTPSYLLEAGYKNIYEFADAEFKLKRSTTHYLIQIIEKFAEKTVTGYNFKLQEAYKDYKYSQLRLLASIDPEQHNYFKPTMTIKEMEDLKKYLEMDEDQKKEDADLEVDTEKEEKYHDIDTQDLIIILQYIEGLKKYLNPFDDVDSLEEIIIYQSDLYDISLRIDAIINKLNNVIKKVGG